ncbi:MAG: DNA recombination protein RmuC [Bacteroidales bacterium]|nr:DNA recombination protein RmuC [Bacteroidales bacterium]
MVDFILSFLAGAAVAALIVYFASKARSERLKADLEHSQAALEEARKEAFASLEQAKADGAESLKRAQEDAERRHEETKAELRKQNAEAMEALQKRFDETIAKVSAQMKAETGEMLKARQKEFADSSNLSLGQIMAPLKENIAELRKAMQEDSKEQAERSGQMRQQISDLMRHSEEARKSADELAAAFKHGSKVQGDWGETLLEELLSSQGLTEGIHFETQAVIRDEYGKPVHNATGVGTLRPDVILHLDEHREVIIDSKVSLTAYVDYVNAEDEATRQAALKAHLESIKKHVKELSVKDYSSYIRPPKVSAGYVIMFVPNAGALWTALNAEPSLWRQSAEQNVFIADEQSLYGALRMVRLTWTQVAQARNHEEVFKLASEMIERVGMFVEKYEAVGKALTKASEEYEDGKKKLAPQGQSILNTTGKLLKLGARNSKLHPVRGLEEVESPAELPAE